MQFFLLYLPGVLFPFGWHVDCLVSVKDGNAWLLSYDFIAQVSQMTCAPFTVNILKIVAVGWFWTVCAGQSSFINMLSVHSVCHTSKQDVR